MKIIDISWPLSIDSTSYKDERDIYLEYQRNFDSDKMRKSSILLSSHAGTHVDAPAHFIEDGIPINKIDLTTLVGPAFVIDLSDVKEKITSGDLERFEIKPKIILLIKTKNSNLSSNDSFNYNFVYLSEDGANYCVTRKIKAVGIDYLGIERNQPNHGTHKTLLQNDITIIEGLRLGHVRQGRYFLVCLPLAVQNLEAAPARAILIENFNSGF